MKLGAALPANIQIQEIYLCVCVCVRPCKSSAVTHKVTLPSIAKNKIARFLRHLTDLYH